MYFRRTDSVLGYRGNVFRLTKKDRVSDAGNVAWMDFVDVAVSNELRREAASASATLDRVRVIEREATFIEAGVEIDCRAVQK